MTVLVQNIWVLNTRKLSENKMTQPSGLSAKELFVRGEGITYDDFTILDTIFTNINREEDINLETKLGDITLQTPIIAAPMDTVTNAALCIALALEGGIGCLHYNHQRPDGSKDVDQQINDIIEVKRYKNKCRSSQTRTAPLEK